MPIRLKLAVLFTALTVFLLVGVGALFLYNLRSGLKNSLNSSLRSQVDDVIAQISPTSDTTAHLRLADSYGQVLTSSGDVLQSTESQLTRPLLTPSQAHDALTTRHIFDSTVRPVRPPTSTDTGVIHVRVLAVPSGFPGTVVAVATSREIVDDATERAEKELLLIGAIVFLVAGPGAWFLTRAALQPVERMRAQAAELQAQDAGAGLTVPGTHDEIARLAQTLNRLLARLHGAVEHERAFVADAGHELRTPLTVLSGELELARRPGRSQAQLLETVEVAAEETERLIRLTEDLLVLARDEQALPIRRQNFDVRSVAESARTAASALAGDRGVAITLSGPEPLFANGDPDRIRQAVDNLLSNAVRYSPRGGVVRIELGRAGSQVEVAVADEGPGFAPDFLPHAFERFRRGDTARRRDAEVGADAGGAGLGLAIVRSILTAHDGTAIAANRREAEGARLTLRWPADQPTAG